MNMGPTRPETSVNSYHTKQRNIAQERRSHLTVCLIVNKYPVFMVAEATQSSALVPIPSQMKQVENLQPSFFNSIIFLPSFLN